MSPKEDGTPRKTPGERKKPDRVSRTVSPDRVQQALDDALADSFPASDPVSIVTSQHEEAWETEHTAPGGADSPARE